MSLLPTWAPQVYRDRDGAFELRHRATQRAFATPRTEPVAWLRDARLLLLRAAPSGGHASSSRLTGGRCPCQPPGELLSSSVGMLLLPLWEKKSLVVGAILPSVIGRPRGHVSLP